MISVYIFLLLPINRKNFPKFSAFLHCYWCISPNLNMTVNLLFMDVNYMLLMLISSPILFCWHCWTLEWISDGILSLGRGREDGSDWWWRYSGWNVLFITSIAYYTIRKSFMFLMRWGIQLPLSFSHFAPYKSLVV